MRSRRQLSASITLLSFNETNLPIKRLVLCGISHSLFLFLKYKNVKIVGGLISRKIDQTTICAQSLEHSSERNGTSFAGYCTNSRKDRSYLDLSRSRKLASSLLLTRSLGTSERKRVSRFVKRRVSLGNWMLPTRGFTIPQVASRQDDKKRYSLRSMDNFSLRLCFHSSII